MHPSAPLILASASPRRRRILTNLGVPFTVQIPEVVEIARPKDPCGSARQNALLKYAWCHARAPEALIIAADTVLDLDGDLIGKPESLQAAAAMLQRLAGRTHTVCTAAALTTHSAPAVHLCKSDVRFRELSADDIGNYLGLVPPLDKAGAYDIDDHGDLLIAAHTGSRTNIMGLPVEIVQPWLVTAGFL